MNDLIDKQSLHKICENEIMNTNPYDFYAHDNFQEYLHDDEIASFGRWEFANGYNTALATIRCRINTNPSMVIIHCKDCKWWNRLEEDHPYGYCRACRSGTHTERWEISIYRQNRYDFYCADAEPKEEEDDDE